VSAVRDADSILVLDGGRIVSRGTHDELARRPGYYADLYRMQLLESEALAAAPCRPSSAPTGDGA